MYTVRMNQKYSKDTMFQYYKDLDENLAWLTQKTEESKCNKPNFTFSPPTQQMQLNCKVIKNWQPLTSTATPPFQVYPLSPLSSKVFGTPSPLQVTPFSEGLTPPPPL